MGVKERFVVAFELGHDTPPLQYDRESVGARIIHRRFCDAQRLTCCGKTLDVGLAQSSVGLAWWFSRYANEQSPEDRGRYKTEEEEARLRKRGLWADEAPVPPWEWRKGDRAKL